MTVDFVWDSRLRTHVRAQRGSPAHHRASLSDAGAGFLHSVRVLRRPHNELLQRGKMTSMYNASWYLGSIVCKSLSTSLRRSQLITIRTLSGMDVLRCLPRRRSLTLVVASPNTRAGSRSFLANLLYLVRDHGRARTTRSAANLRSGSFRNRRDSWWRKDGCVLSPHVLGARCTCMYLTG